MANPQEHYREHWKQAEGGHKAECKRLKASKGADLAAALGLGLPPTPAGGSGSGACPGGWLLIRVLYLSAPPAPRK